MKISELFISDWVKRPLSDCYKIEFFAYVIDKNRKKEEKE